MGFLDSVFNPGKSAAKRAKVAGAQADKILKKALPKAQEALVGGYDEASATYDQGYGAAGDWLEDYYNLARDEIAGGYDAVPDILDDYYGRADDRLVEGRDTARELLDPWITSGRAAQDVYDMYLDPTRQAEFFDSYQESPYAAFGYEMDEKRQNAISNAGGNLYGGKGQLAASRVRQERAEGNLQTYLGQLERQGTRGGQYATEAAGLEERTGTRRAGLQTDLGTRLADNSVNRGVTLGKLDYGYGTDRGNLETDLANQQANLQLGKGSDLANLIYGHAQQRAGNVVGTMNAVNQAKAVGKQNLIGGLSLAASAFIPGAAGVSAAGALGNRLLGTVNRATGNAYGDAGLGSWMPVA
jgi:hypothetical protein